MDADLVLYKLDHTFMLPYNNPLQLLVLGRPTDVVKAAWGHGRQLFDQWQLLTVDTAALHQTLRHQSQAAQKTELPHSSGKPHYRQVMLNR